MRKIFGIVLSVALIVGLGLSEAYAATADAETREYGSEEYRLADTPSKFGPKGLIETFDPYTYQGGKFGLGVFFEMTRFCLPGDPRYPELMEIGLMGAYGITDKLEVGVSAPFRNLKIPAASTTGRWPEDEALDEISESGISNVSLTLRYNLIGNEDQTSFAVTPFVQALLPTASDPEVGTGAENTRIRLGMSAGAPLGIARLYTQVAYQYATDYDQDEQNFSERQRYAMRRPRFDYFGTNPLFHEYGNTLFYNAGLAFPLGQSFELFGEFLGYHSFEDQDYIPMFEDYDTPGDYEPLDVVQDGAMGIAGAQIGFGNGFALKGGWGGILFAEEPMYESPHWRVFAALSYNRPHEVVTIAKLDEVDDEVRGAVEDGGPQVKLPPPGGPPVNCDEIYEIMVNFEFDKATLTPEGMAALDRLGALLRACTDSIEVGGHTDWVGTENYNMKLAARRARAVVYYLVYDQGIDPARVVISPKLTRTPQLIAGESYGESQPIASNETDAGRAQNRRVQFTRM